MHLLTRVCLLFVYYISEVIDAATAEGHDVFGVVADSGPLKALCSLYGIHQGHDSPPLFTSPE